MINLEEFTAIFNTRHDFDYDDFDYLSNKYPTVCFENIPEAWVCIIDSFLQNISDIENVKLISQVMGHLIVKSRKCFTSDDSKLLVEMEKTTIQLDIDLHRALGEGIVLN